MQFFEQGGAGEFDSADDEGRVEDAELADHDEADVVEEPGHEFVVEDVVVDCVAYAAADDSHCECQSCDCGDEVLVFQSRLVDG